MASNKCEVYRELPDGAGIALGPRVGRLATLCEDDTQILKSVMPRHVLLVSLL